MPFNDVLVYHCLGGPCCLQLQVT